MSKRGCPSCFPDPADARRPEAPTCPLALVGWIALAGYLFANVEIQIEGAAGWASALPTWRVENNALISFFLGGRVLTGYHFWVFSFMLVVFHLPLFLGGGFSWRKEARILGSLMLFWIWEDFLWFVLNPAYGLGRFAPAAVPWHKHWLFGVPVDYLTSTLGGVLLVAWSYRRRPFGGGRFAARISRFFHRAPGETPGSKNEISADESAAQD